MHTIFMTIPVDAFQTHWILLSDASTQWFGGTLVAATKMRSRSSLNFFLHMIRGTCGNWAMQHSTLSGETACIRLNQLAFICHHISIRFQTWIFDRSFWRSWESRDCVVCLTSAARDWMTGNLFSRKFLLAAAIRLISMEKRKEEEENGSPWIMKVKLTLDALWTVCKQKLPNLGLHHNFHYGRTCRRII